MDTAVDIEKLDFNYIEKCNDAATLKQIYEVLCSGKEGHYPELTQFAEKRLLEVDPKAKLSRAVPESKLSTENQEQSEELLKWIKGVQSDETMGNDDVAKFATKQRAAKERMKGNEFYSSGELEQAFDCYSESIRLDGSDAKVYTNRAIVSIKLAKYKVAESDCTAALGLTETHAASIRMKALSRRGLARFKMGQYGRSIDDFGEAYVLQATPDLDQLIENALKHHEDVEGFSYKDPRPATLELPSYPPDKLICVWPQLGNAKEVGNGSCSVTVAVGAGAYSSTDIDECAGAEMLKVRGNKAMQAGQPLEAVGLYSAALSRVTGGLLDANLMVSCRNNRSAALLQLQKYHAVVTDTGAVLAADPANTKAYFRRAQALQALGDLRAALVDTDSVLRISSTSVQGRALREELLAELERKGE